MFTRFVNPHSLDAKVEIVSRDTITAGDTESGSGAVRDDALLTDLDRLVKRSLGDLGTSEDADEKARRKRRKTEKKHANDAQEESTNSLTSILAFRLVSRTLPPKEIELKPKEAPVIVVREPPCEDNEDEAARRGARAQEVAVHFAQIIHEAQRLSTSHRVEARGAIHMKGKVSSPPPPVMVVEWDKPPPKTPKLASARPFVELRPSPHTLGPNINVPVIAVTTASAESKTKTSRNIRRARAKARTAQPRPPAMFWRPLREWGVQAAGYSVGYEGSWPVSQNDPSRYQYQRDTMRKGIFSTGQ